MRTLAAEVRFSNGRPVRMLLLLGDAPRAEPAPEEIHMSRPSARLRWIQYGVVAQISVICLINYMDRTTLAIANPAIRHDMGLSLSQMGLLLGAFPLTYALSQLPLGPIIDRLGSRLLLGAGLAVWSLAQGVAALAGSAVQLLVCRVMLGVGEGPTIPSCTKVVRRWFNVRERGRPVGVFTGANHLGQAIAAPVLTIMMVAMGWRWMFATMGILGFICVIVWFATYRDPDDADLSESDRTHLAEADTMHNAPPMNFAQWRGLFGFRTSWGLWLGVFGSGYMSGIYATWLPAYLEIERHMSIQQAGLVAAIPYTLAVVGSLFAGWAADALQKRGVSALNSGRVVFVAGLLGMAGFSVLTALAAGVVLAVVWLCTATFFSQLSGSCSWVAANAAVPENCVGSFGGVMNCFGYVGGAIAPVVTGLAVDVTGSFVMPLVVGATISLVAAVIYWFLPRGPIRAEDISARTQMAFGQG
jgi:MFS family permease